MDNSESNIDFIQILAAFQHLQQENVVLKTSSPLLQDFNTFMAEFEAVFGDNDKARTQLACDVNWGEVALIDQFRYGLHDDVQDLLLTLAYPSSFSEAITQAIRCDNHLFKHRQENKVTSNAQLWNSRPTTLPLVPQTTPVIRPASFGPAPMHIDTAKFKSLTKAKKLR
ncbi:hypothetical protein CY35_18G092400 [Sphagnum magellanicum]|nr:hypothetical protein CY35_18G092400 [Sphagnum magellanicum]